MRKTSFHISPRVNMPFKLEYSYCKSSISMAHNHQLLCQACTGMALQTHTEYKQIRIQGCCRYNSDKEYLKKVSGLVSQSLNEQNTSTCMIKKQIDKIDTGQFLKKETNQAL